MSAVWIICRGSSRPRCPQLDQLLRFFTRSSKVPQGEKKSALFICKKPPNGRNQQVKEGSNKQIMDEFFANFSSASQEALEILWSAFDITAGKIPENCPTFVAALITLSQLNSQQDAMLIEKKGASFSLAVRMASTPPNSQFLLVGRSCLHHDA